MGIIAGKMTHVDLNITAGREQVQQPLIWRLCHEFDVTVNIRKASIDGDFGWIQIELSGATEEIQRATAWLMTTGVNVEAQQRAVGA
jgi:ABC-type methionine transport system ATPase subunit